jgi:transposase
MGSNRTTPSETAATQPAICGSSADPGSRGPDRDPLCAPLGAAVEHAAARDGLRLRHDLLAAPRALATGGRLEAAAYRAAQRIAAAGPNRSGARRGRQRLPPRAARGKKTGPNPTDRRKAGSKHHVLTDAHGIPLVARLTAAHRHDVTQLLPLVDAMPALQGRAGRPVRKPQLVQGDRGYDSQPHRNQLLARGIASQLAKRGTPHGSGLGRTRWVVERTLAWLHRFRRLAVRYERRPCIHEAFLTLACSLVCWYYLKPVI